MMVVTVLKKKHSLVGHSMLPVIRAVRTDASSVMEFARLEAEQQLELLSPEELQKAVRTLTNEDPADILQMAQREENSGNLCLLVHHTILHANEFGQPKGQQLIATPPDLPVTGEPPVKKVKMAEQDEQLTSCAPPEGVKIAKEKEELSHKIPVWEVNSGFMLYDSSMQKREHQSWINAVSHAEIGKSHQSPTNVLPFEQIIRQGQPFLLFY
ncbi:uncharacterized protein LOC135492179 [Lineus longissimus]|uniref:uncharacterized protein LOC135492179 n=1 Tax=Lineus longissimus TaxID=88925 RepID=UPI00315CF1AF